MDTHCHLDSAQYAPGDVVTVLERAAAAGVARMVTVGVDLCSSRRAVALAAAYDRVWAAVGVSPNDLDGHGPEALGELAALARSDRVVAIGEIGLDYHWLRSPAALQRARFRAQLELAGSLGLPVIVHSRKAHEDTLADLAEWSAGRSDHERPAGVMHCFSGDVEQARAFAALGLMVSLAGNVTYPGAERLRAVAAAVEADRLVLETDSPYLYPVVPRGGRNEPSGVRAVAEVVARARRTSLAQVGTMTSANAAHLFGWRSWPS